MGSLFGGGDAGKSEMKEANKLMRDNIAKLEAIGIPTIEAQRIALESPELVEPLVAEQMGPSAMEGVQMDPRLQAAQRAALDEMTGLGQTGLGAEDRAAFNQLRRQAAGAAEAQQASTQREMAARGMADSGTNLIAQLQAGQSSADRMSQEGDRLAASAAEARRAALSQQANMASQMSAADLGLKGQKASAADTIAQFNTQQRAGVNAANQGYKVGRASELANIKNQEQIGNKALIQQQFQNQMARAGGVANQQNALASSLQQQGSAAQQAQQAQTGALLNLAGTLGGAAIGGPAGAAAGGAIAGAVAPKPVAVNYQTGQNKYGNIA
jgi:hypothetical protein